MPFSSEIGPGVVKLLGHNGYLATWEIDGLAFETSSEDDLDVQNEALHQFLIGLSGGGFAIWTHEIHTRVKDRLQDRFANEYSAKLAQAYDAKLNGVKQMRTRLFLTIVYRPGELSTFGKVGMGSLEAMAALELEAIEVLDELSSRVTSSLKPFGPRRLSRFVRSVDDRPVEYSELASFLGYLVNGIWQDMPVINKPLANYICTSRLTAADRSGVLQLDTRQGRKFVTSFEIKEYPEFVSPTALARLMYLDRDYVLTHSYSIKHSRDAEVRLRRQRTQMASGGEASAKEIEEFESAIELMRSGSLLFGEYHFNLAVFSDTLAAVKDDRAEVLSALESEWFKGEAQTVVPEAAWFHQMPGNWRYRTREALITSRCFSALAPLHNFMAGKRTGNPWGEAICVLDSPSGQPYFFNFHASPEQHDSTDDKLPGNACIFGMTGSGKTTLEMFLLCHLNKYGARSFILDMDRSTEITVRRLGGVYRDLRRGEPTGINPFQWPDSAKTRAFCRKVVTHIMEHGRAKLEPDEENTLASAIDSVFAAGVEIHHRRLSLVAQYLPNVERNSLSARLTRWIGNGDLAWVLDNELDQLKLDSADVFGFDFSEFIADPQVCPVVTMCLLEIFETLTNGRPIALLMEEFWRLLADPVFTEFARDKLKTIRKENGIVIMTTQQTDDVLSTPLAGTAVQQHVTGLYLPNPRASRSAYVDGFRLTETEFEIVRSLPVDSRAFLVKQAGKSAVVRLNLSGMGDVIAVLSGDLETVEILSEIQARVGDDPLHWEPEFLQTVAQKKTQKKITSKAGVTR